MARGLYISGTGPRCGKSVVMLGIMEMLAGQTANISFFRPVAYPDAASDHAIRLVSGVHRLQLQPDALCGYTYE